MTAATTVIIKLLIAKYSMSISSWKLLALASMLLHIHCMYDRDKEWAVQLVGLSMKVQQGYWYGELGMQWTTRRGPFTLPLHWMIYNSSRERVYYNWIGVMLFHHIQNVYILSKFGSVRKQMVTIRFSNDLDVTIHNFICAVSPHGSILLNSIFY